MNSKIPFLFVLILYNHSSHVYGWNNTTTNFQDITFFATDYSPAENESFCIDVKTLGFTSIISMQFSLGFDTAHFQFDSVSGFNINPLSENNFGTNNAPDGKIIFTWIDEPLFNGETLPDSATIFQVCFTAVGQVADSSLFEMGDMYIAVEIVDVGFNELTAKFMPAELKIVPAALPPCTTLSAPLNGSANVPTDNQLAWLALANANGYFLSIGTSSGGTDILNNLDVGNTSTYNIGIWPSNAAIFVNLTPYNSTGNAIGCMEESFTTGECPAFNETNWISTIGLWVNPINWDTGAMPVPCSEVKITSGDVLLTNGFAAVGKTLEVATGATLEVQLGAVMSIK